MAGIPGYLKAITAPFRGKKSLDIRHSKRDAGIRAADIAKVKQAVPGASDSWAEKTAIKLRKNGLQISSDASTGDLEKVRIIQQRSSNAVRQAELNRLNKLLNGINNGNYTPAQRAYDYAHLSFKDRKDTDVFDAVRSGLSSAQLSDFWEQYKIEMGYA